MSISQRTNNILKELPKEVILVAATKSRSVQEIQQAIDAGITAIGENYVQEAETKFGQLDRKVELHCLGHLQTNKVKKAVMIFDMIQTVDSLSLARTIDKECAKISKVMPILIEVNSSAEPQKSGCLPQQVEPLLSQLILLKNIKPVGLMTMGPAVENKEDIRPFFKQTKQLFDKLKLNYHDVLDWKCLSMGMSGTWPIAIQEGATMIRIGTEIFGERT